MKSKMMTNDKILCLIFLIVLSSAHIICQTDTVRYRICTGCNRSEGVDSINGTYSYGPVLDYQSRDVTSDFGPRYNSYDWHKGVDYRPVQFPGHNDNGRGTGILAVSPGTVEKVRATSGYKYIAIDGVNDFGYGHIFNARNPTTQYIKSGNLVLKKMNNSTDYAIIDVGNGTAFSETTGAVTFNGINYVVTDQVIDDQLIAPMGGGGGSQNSYRLNDPFACHLHFYHYDNVSANNLVNEVYPTNCIDPLRIVAHDEPDYEVNLRSAGQSSFGLVDLKIGHMPTKFLVRPIMMNAMNRNGLLLGNNGSDSRYSNVVLNIDSVAIRIKEQGTSHWSIIRGNDHFGALSQGGRNSNDMYPQYLALDNESGGWTKHGIDPVAYGDIGGFPYDDYYFIDFYSRLNTTDQFNSGGAILAESPEDALYKDGTNYLQGYVKTIRDAIWTSDSIEVYIDNFKPYIKSIQAFVGDIKIYDFEWSTVNGKLQPNGGIVRGAIPFGRGLMNQGMRVEVEASEQLHTLSLDLHRSVGSPCLPESPTTVSSVATMDPDRRTWTFNFTNLGMCSFGLGAIDVTGTDWRFQFTGQDYGPDGNPGSSLIDFSGAYDVIVDRAQNTVPQLALDHRVSTTPGSEWSGTQDASLTTGVDDTHYFRFACSDPGNFHEPDNDNTSASNKLMEDEVLRFVCCEEELNIILDPLFQPFDNENCGPVGTCEMALVVAIEGQEGVGLEGTTPTFTWSNGDTGQNISGLCSGTYTVTATTEAGCTSEASFELCCLDLEVLELVGSNTITGSGVINIQINSDVAIVSAAIDGNNFTSGVRETGLPAGEYEVEVITEAGCRIIRLLTIESCEDDIVLDETIHSFPSNDNMACGFEFTADQVPDSGQSYQWSDGSSGPVLLDACLSTSYFLTVTNSAGCTVKLEKHFFCASMLNENPSEVMHPESVDAPEISLLTNADLQIEDMVNVNNISVLSWVGVEGSFSTGDPVDFTQNFRRIRIQNMPIGRGEFLIEIDDYCDQIYRSSSRRCLREGEVILSATTNGTFVGGSSEIRMFGIVDLKIEGPRDLYASLTYSLEDEAGNVVSTSNEPNFVISFPGRFRIVAIDECGNRWESFLATFSDCGDDPIVLLEVNDACNSGVNLSYPWFKVEGFIAAQGLMFVGEAVNVLIEYDYLDDNIPDEIWYDGDGIIESIVSWPQTSERYTLSSPSYKYKVKEPGFAKVIITSKQGCVFEAYQSFKRRSINFPVVTQSGEDEWLGNSLVADSIEFWRPVWIGYAKCKSCVDERLLDRLSRWNGRGGYSPQTEDVLCNTKGDRERFAYIPRDSVNPCKLGGTLLLHPEYVGVDGNDNGEIEINVEPSGWSRYFQNGDQCGCLFQSDAVSWTLGPADRQDIHVYVQWFCGEPIVVEPDDPEISQGLIDSLCQAANCTNCTIIEDNCRANLVCEDGFIAEYDIHLRWSEEEGPCVVMLGRDEQNKILAVVGTPCASDPCNSELFSIDFGGLHIDPPLSQTEYDQLVSMYSECETTEVCNVEEFIDKMSKRSETEQADFSGDFVLYPNPVSLGAGRLRLEFIESTKPLSIEFIDVLGRTLFTKVGLTKSDSIDMEDFPKTKGVVFVRVKYINGSIQTKKIIIK